MAKSNDRTVLRFAVVGENGKRSSTWRIWTGASRPSDDTYIAPRYDAQFKISLHKDGYCQHGPIDVLRRSIRPEDRAALDRWELPQDRTATPAYFLLFPPDHLREYATPLQDATAVAIASTTLIRVFILDSTTDLDLLPGGTLVGTLDRANGGVVAVISTTSGPPFAVTDTVRATFNQPSSVWTPPGYDTSEPRAAFAFMEMGGSHGVIELTPDPGLAMQPLQLPDFAGEVRRRADLAWWPGHLDLCAVLIVDPDDASPARACLYLDPAARCDHAVLADEASRLTASFKPEDAGNGWDRLTDGRWTTGILCRDAAHRAGVHGSRIPGHARPKQPGGSAST